MRCRKFVALSAIFGLSIATLGLTGPAAALSPIYKFGTDGAGVQQVAEQFSAREIYAFAEAANQVAKITQAWTPKIEGAPSATLANQYKQKAVSQMQQAILASGLTMDKYQYIGKAAKRDPMLREEIRELVDEMN